MMMLAAAGVELAPEISLVSSQALLALVALTAMEIVLGMQGLREELEATG